MVDFIVNKFSWQSVLDTHTPRIQGKRTNNFPKQKLKLSIVRQIKVMRAVRKTRSCETHYSSFERLRFLKGKLVREE